MDDLLYSDNNQYIMRSMNRPSLVPGMYGVHLTLESSDTGRRLSVRAIDATVERSIDGPARFTIRIPKKEFSGLAGNLTTAQRFTLNSFYGLPKFRPIPKKVIYNYPATIVFWDDGTKTVVKCRKGEIPDLNTAIAYAVCKKIYGNMSHFDKLFTRDAEVVVQRDPAKALKDNKEMELAIREVARLAKEQEKE